MKRAETKFVKTICLLILSSAMVGQHSLANTTSPTPTPSSTPYGQDPNAPLTENRPAQPVTTVPSSQGSSTGQGSSGASESAKASGDPCSQKSGASQQVLQQSGEYCAAAEAAEKAAKNQQMLGGVHAGVAGICLIPCAANNLFGSGMLFAQICSGASIAAGVTDAVVTQQFTGAAGALVGAYGLIRSFGADGGAKAAVPAGAAASATGTKAASSSTTAAAKEGAKGTNMDMTSCVTAAVETGMSVMNFIGSENSKKTAKENRELAQQLTDAQAKAVQASTDFMPPPAASTGAVAVNGIVSDSSKLAATSSDSPSGGGLGNGGFSSNKKNCDGYTNSLQCAASNGGNGIPAIASNPAFISQLEKLSGLPIDNLMAKSNTAGIIDAVAGQSLGEEKRGMVAAAIAKAEQDLRAGSHVAPATYSGGGAGGNSSSADPMAGLGDALAALTQGLNGKSKDGAPLGPKSEQFGSHAAANSIVGTEQDRSMSLFTRVSRRYAASRDRIFSLQYASPQNRALTR